MEFKKFFNRTLRFINPEVPIGGLEISDAFLRFVIFKNGAPQAISVKLPPGVLEDGKIKDFKSLTAALADLRLKIGFSSAPQNVIVTLVSSLFYSQVFGLPNLPQYKVNEAIDLNLKMISPIPIENAYFDSQYVGDGASGEREFLGAFVEKSFIDPIIEVLKETGFIPVAVEFSALSVARVLKLLGSAYDFSRPFLVVNFLAHGVDFMILRGGEPYFRYFSSFDGALERREINFEEFEFLIKREVARVLNFYTSRKGGAIADAIVVGSQLGEQIKSILEPSFGLKIYDFEINSYKELPLPFMAAMGAALRGGFSRAEDVFISLAPEGTEAEFKKERLMRFVIFWRNVMLSVFSFIFLAMLLVDSSLSRLGGSIERESRIVNILDNQVREFDELRIKANDFNRTMALALKAKEQSAPQSPILEDIRKAAGLNVILKRIYIQFDQGTGLVTGRASSELSAISFKNSIAANTKFSSVSLPLSNITHEIDGKVSFQLSFKIVSSR